MSEDQLQALQEAVKAEAGLQEQLKAASDMDAVVAIANEAGFMISAEELKKARAEVSDKELEGLAGGRSYNYDQAITDYDLSTKLKAEAFQLTEEELSQHVQYTPRQPYYKK